ncbi:hypothetical protein M8J77_007454 [Diaphorina citri]|nr:hypothetical protein M8J77_007454 [Diaphorina citri]
MAEFRYVLSSMIAATAAFLFLTQDHFNLEQDMENYVKFQIMKEGPIRLRPGVIPHKFICQKSQTTAHI